MTTAIRIKSIKRKGIAPTYDVKNVGGNHLYIGPKNLIVHNCLDELNAVDNKSDSFGSRRMELTKVFKTYTEVSARMTSRFMEKGLLPLESKLFLISQTEDDAASFLDKYIEKVQNDNNVLIYNDPLWKILPSKTFSGATFQMACGTEHHPPKIIEKNEDIQLYLKEGHRILYDCPIEYHKIANLSPSTFLTRHAGISTRQNLKHLLIPQQYFIEQMFKRDYTYHPFTREYLVLDIKNKDQTILEYFIIEKLFNKSAPHYLHCDMSKNKDFLGLAMVHPEGLVEVEKINELTGQLEKKKETKIIIDFVLQVRPPYASEIPMYKIRQFLFNLKKLGVNISKCTLDQYQSEETKQGLIMGGIDSEILSVDRNDIPYKNLRDCVLFDRINAYEYAPLRLELSELIHDREKGKVNHPEKNMNGEVADKESTDALCGAVWNCTKDNIQPATNLVDMFKKQIQKNKSQTMIGAVPKKDLGWVYS